MISRRFGLLCGRSGSAEVCLFLSKAFLCSLSPSLFACYRHHARPFFSALPAQAEGDGEDEEEEQTRDEEAGRDGQKKSGAGGPRKQKKAFYEAHLKESEINRRLKKREVFQGKLRMASDCCWRGVVLLPGGKVPPFLAGGRERGSLSC